MIKIQNLNLKLDDTVIFKNANIEIPENKITMIVGPNGTGKTTLLKVITKEIKTDCKLENTFKKVFYLPQKLYYPKGISTFDYLSSVFFKNTYSFIWLCWTLVAAGRIFSCCMQTLSCGTWDLVP